MRQLGGLLYWISKVLFVALLTQPVAAKTQKDKSQAKVQKKASRNAQLSNSVQDAKKRAEKEQKIIRVKLDFEADERHKEWVKAHEDYEFENKSKPNNMASSKMKRPLKKSSIERLRFEKADFDLDNSGEDTSGLDDIRSSTDDDDIKIDFDKELREVSSLKP